jgi:hypothetical protein
MGSMAGTFTIPEFNSSYTITDSNLVRIGDKHFLEKNHVRWIALVKALFLSRKKFT